MFVVDIVEIAATVVEEVASTGSYEVRRWLPAPARLDGAIMAVDVLLGRGASTIGLRAAANQGRVARRGAGFTTLALASDYDAEVALADQDRIRLHVEFLVAEFDKRFAAGTPTTFIWSNPARVPYPEFASAASQAGLLRAVGSVNVPTARWDAFDMARRAKRDVSRSAKMLEHQELVSELLAVAGGRDPREPSVALSTSQLRRILSALRG